MSLFNKPDLDKEFARLTKATEKNIQSTIQSLNDICEILSEFHKNKYTKHDAFFNLCIFSDIFNIDITILLEKFRLSDKQYERKLYARLLAVIIIDFLDNVNTLLGRDCLAELKNNNMGVFLEEFKAVHKRFSQLKSSNEGLLRDIRNNTLAHKTKDGLVLHRKINQLNDEKIYEFGLTLKQYSNDFVDISTRVIYFIVDYMKRSAKL